MKRDEIIQRIEHVLSNDASEQWCEEFREELRQGSQQRNALSDDFHRAIVYCFIVFTRVGYLNKERRNFLRPTRRSVLMTLGLLVAVVLQVYVLAILCALLGVRDYALIIIVFALFFELGYVVTKGNRLIRGHMGDELGLSTACTGCGYDLGGLDSVLGEHLWVGPEVCPECGHPYPAIV